MLASAVKFFFGSSKRIVPKAVSALQFNKLYQKIVSTQQNKKFVVVIDNLDRCDDKITVDLLGIIQTFMVKENCINILACDDDAIVKHLRRVKGNDYSERDGNEFLSKFFQLTLVIPPFIGENLEKYANELIHSRNVDFSDFVRPILISGAIENPRKINQFLNNAVALYRLAKYKEEDRKLPKGIITKHTDFLVKMIVIRHEWPLFHKALEKDPSLISDANARAKWIQNEKVVKVQIDGLDDFLNKTAYSMVDDDVVRAFLRLNQESYSAESGIEEFAEAVTSNDIPTVTKLFENLNSDMQNQYIKKLQELTDAYADKNNISSLLICTNSIIAILEILKEKQLRGITIALLGRHMSTKLLSELDKYDLSKHNLFSYFEEMAHLHSEPIYDKLLEAVIDEIEINKNLVKQFFKNGQIVCKKIMNKLDVRLTEFMKTDEIATLDFLVELCNSCEWPQINIPKPSSLLTRVIDNIKFDSSEIDNKRISTCISIYNKIHEKERAKYIKHLEVVVKKCSEDSAPLHAPLLESITTVISNFETSPDSLEILCLSLSDSLRFNPDNEQKKAIVELLVKSKSKLINSDRYENIIHESLEAFLETGDLDSMLWFKTLVENSKTNYMDSEQVLHGCFENVKNNDALNNADVLKFILYKTPTSQHMALTEKITQIIETNNLSKYQTILNILAENPADFTAYFISSVISSCKSLSSEMEYPEYLAFDEIIIKLHTRLYPYQVEDIYKRAINLTQSDDPSMQDAGLKLLSAVNDATNSSELIGINELISRAEKFINENNDLARKYLDFILKYSQRLGFAKTDQIADLVKLSLNVDKPALIHDIGLDCASQNIGLMKSVSGHVIKLATGSSDEAVREKCKRLLIDQKDHLLLSEIGQVKELFGESVFD